jgi:hypothetical protein
MAKKQTIQWPKPDLKVIKKQIEQTQLERKRLAMLTKEALMALVEKQFEIVDWQTQRIEYETKERIDQVAEFSAICDRYYAIIQEMKEEAIIQENVTRNRFMRSKRPPGRPPKPNLYLLPQTLQAPPSPPPPACVLQKNDPERDKFYEYVIEYKATLKAKGRNATDLEVIKKIAMEAKLGESIATKFAKKEVKSLSRFRQLNGKLIRPKANRKIG